MGSVLNFMVLVVLTVVLVWVVVFGGVGALLAGSRGGSYGLGFAWGALLGPIGWVVILYITRGGEHSGRAIPGALNPTLDEAERYDLDSGFGEDLDLG